MLSPEPWERAPGGRVGPAWAPDLALVEAGHLDAPSAGAELQRHAECDSWQRPAGHCSPWQERCGPAPGEPAAVASHIQDMLGEQLASAITTTLVFA